MANDAPPGLLWTFTTDPSNMWIPRAPILVGDAGVVVASDGMTVYCLNAQTGVPVWKGVSDRGRLIGGFAVLDGCVYITDGWAVRALDLKDGSDIWRYDCRNLMKDMFFSAPGVSDRLVVVAADDGTVRAVRRSSGAEMWVQKYSDAVQSNFVGDDNSVYYADASSLKALDAQDGSLQWSFPAPYPLAPGQMTPIAADGSTVFAAFGNLYAIDAARGTPSGGTFMNPRQGSRLTNLVLDSARTRILMSTDEGAIFLHNYFTLGSGAYPYDDRSPLHGGLNSGAAFVNSLVAVSAGDRASTRLSLLSVPDPFGSFEPLFPAGYDNSWGNGLVISGMAASGGVVIVFTAAPDAGRQPQVTAQIMAIQVTGA
jgi:hypothetical protein